MPYADVVAAARARRQPTPDYSTVAGVQAGQDQAIGSDMNYDASAALDKYARGAYASVSDGLQRTLADTRGRSVGAGRFDSGYLDENQGEVIRQTQNDFSNNLAQQSMNAERTTQDVRGRGEDLMLARSEQVQNDARDMAERARRKRSGIGSAIGSVLGGAGGAYLGGPWGASVGAQLGGAVGGSF
ncbi:MAG: hypothetical protein ABJA80_04035 [bacterium]